MDAVQMQKDLSLIKEMIERTKKSIAESGSLMVYIGVFTAVLLALINSPYEFLILVAAITLGWTMPGVYLNRVNKNRSA